MGSRFPCSLKNDAAPPRASGEMQVAPGHHTAAFFPTWLVTRPALGGGPLVAEQLLRGANGRSGRKSAGCTPRNGPGQHSHCKNIVSRFEPYRPALADTVFAWRRHAGPDSIDAPPQRSHPLTVCES